MTLSTLFFLLPHHMNRLRPFAANLSHCRSFPRNGVLNIPFSQHRLPSPPSSSVPFSTQGPRLSQPSSQPKSNHKEQPTPTQPGSELKGVTWESLGISRNMRIVVIVLFSGVATVETWFYCQWAWRWWKNRSAVESEEAVE